MKKLLLTNSRTGKGVCLQGKSNCELKDMEEFIDSISDEDGDDDIDSDIDDEIESRHERDTNEVILGDMGLIENNHINKIRNIFNDGKENSDGPKVNKNSISPTKKVVEQPDRLETECSIENMSNNEKHEKCFTNNAHEKDTVKEYGDICTVCNRSFQSTRQLTIHMRKMHSMGSNFTDRSYKFECEICFKRFQKQTSLDLHVEIHLGTQKYTCNVCDAMFSRKHDFIRHSTRHSGEKPYKCDMCEKRYRMPGDLGRHRTVAHGTGNVCDVCGKKYVRKFDLKQHKARHHKNVQTVASRDVPHETKNKNTFKRETEQLDVGQRSGQIHVCPYCDKSFSTSSNRSKHVRCLHSNVSFTCDTCCKEFKAKYDLSFHIQTIHKF